MLDVVSVVFILFTIGVIMYALAEGCNININVTFKHEVQQDYMDMLEDLYNKDGDEKERLDINEALDTAVQAINDIMLDNEEESHG